MNYRGAGTVFYCARSFIGGNHEDVGKELAKEAHVYNLPELFGPTNAAEDFYNHARKDLAAKKASRLYTKFDAKTYPDYSGRYRITRPNIMSGQMITVTAGAGQIYFQLNAGGRLEVLPGSPTSFFLLVSGGMDFLISFPRDGKGIVNGLTMEGSGLSLSATRVD